ncbi:GTPase-activating protein [Culicoides brevitarsis]|uniref:GTPase-activating protein n=1 Tax=Culicoides brevitarsis TaxID=469753 RepID=UPI00307BB654
MAADARIRECEQLRIKIGEAKNLLGRTNSCGTVGNRDVYCTVALDQEEICRTPTIERTLSPFFGEEYQFEIPRKFRFLSVYIWDRDKHLKQDKPIGKIAIKREELHGYNNKDHWFSLRPVDEDSEVQGMAQIEIAIDDGSTTLTKRDDFGANSDAMKENALGTIAAHGSPAPKSILKTNSEFSKKANILESLSALRIETKPRIILKLTECIDLARKNGSCDPYAVVTAFYSNKRKVVKRTKVKKKTVNPAFNEIMCFDLSVDSNESKHDSNSAYTVAPLGGADLSEITITLWHDSPVMGDDVFLGEIKLQVRGKQQQNALQPCAWYFLQPRSTHSRQPRSCATPPGTRLSSDSSMGSLRLKLHYTADHVFPLATYDNLLNLLIQSMDQKPITASAVYILGEIISNKTEVAQPLVRLFTYKNLIAPMIKALADHEISKLTDPTTIFRGNTLVSKMMDEAMRLSGLHYLHSTLRPIVEEIIAERKPCEIDPMRVKDEALISTNLVNLQNYVEKVFAAITQSATKCPTVLCQIFHDLRESAAKHFPDNKEVRFSVVSGFIFLRFFAPAILGPKLFDLTNEPLDAQTTRTLTLISKTIQSLGNLVSSRSAQQPCKEQYTGQLYKQFCTEKHVDAVKHFLQVISTFGTHSDNDIITEPVLLKEGMMTKRAQGRKRFGRRNFKTRFFRMTTQSLSYSKAKGKKILCDIPLTEILTVRKVDERSFKMQNIFEICRKERPLYVQAANCVEEKEWIDLLNKLIQTNVSRLEYIHKSLYINGQWSCCDQQDEQARGCTTVSQTPLQMELATTLDPARDLQRIHSLIMSHIAKLQMITDSDPSNSYVTAVVGPPASSDVDEFEACRRTLTSLEKIATSLEKIHRNYKTLLARDIRIGSVQAPIGDDNYLHMVRTNLTGQAQTIAHMQHLDNSPNFFHRNHLLRCSENEKYSK